MRLIIATFCLLVAPNAFADQASQRSAISIRSGSLSSKSTHVTLSVLALGRRYDLSLTRTKGYSAKTVSQNGVQSTFADAKPQLYQGLRARRHYENRFAGAAADVINGTLTITFPSRNNRLISLSAPINELGSAKASLATSHRSCATEAAAGSANPIITLDPSINSSGPIYSPPRYIEISTDADYEYYANFRSSANAHIQAVLNSVEAIYMKQLGIGFDLIAQNVFTKPSQPYTSSDSDILLTQFQNYTNSKHHLGKADTYHLFTGKDLNQNIIGLSYVGAICTDNEAFSFGLSQKVPATIEPILTAHELGHVLGANHDPSAGSIMSPYLSLDDSQFTNQSLGEMASYIYQNGLCLADTKTLRLKLSVKAQSKQNGKLTSVDAKLKATNDSAECSLYLFGANNRAALLKPDLSVSSATLITSQLSQAGQLRLSASVTNKPRKAEKYTYLRGQVTCPDGRFAYSDIGSFKGKVSVSALTKAAIN